MSVTIPFEELKEAGETVKLKKLLTLVSSPKKKFRSSQYEKKKVVSMFMIEEKNIYLPYTFSKKYFQGTKFEKYLKFGDYPFLFPEGKEGKFKGVLRDYQVQPYKEAKKYLKREKTITLALYPSFGKTFFGSLFSWYLNSYTVVLVHRKTIADAWLKTYHQFIDLPSDQVVMVDKDLSKIKKGEKESAATRGKIFICLDQQWKYIPPETRKKIRLLIIDEAHTFCAPSKVEALLFLHPEYVIAETATPERVDDGLETVIQTICGTHFIQRDNTKSFRFYVIKTGINIDVCGDKNKFGELIEKQCENKKRNSILLDLVKKHSHFKTMIVGKRTFHCGYLRTELENCGLECATLYGTQKKCATKNILIGTDSKMGTGFDEANACVDYDDKPSELLFILHTYAKKSSFTQVVGRGLRSKNPKVVVFCDENRMVKSHIRSMKIWAEELNGTVINISSNNIEQLEISQC